MSMIENLTHQLQQLELDIKNREEYFDTLIHAICEKKTKYESFNRGINMVIQQSSKPIDMGYINKEKERINQWLLEAEFMLQSFQSVRFSEVSELNHQKEKLMQEIAMLN